jgi:hypothetical protein
MAAPRESKPRTRRYSARYQARLNAETHAKLQELAAAFHRKRSAILRFVLQWWLTQTQGWNIDQSVPATVQPVPLLVEPDLLQQGQGAAAAHGAMVATWSRQAMRQVTAEDFPQRWRLEELTVRSHDSRVYGQRFMVRLDAITAQQLQAFVAQFDRWRAEIILQLVAQAKTEDVLPSWQVRGGDDR